MSQPLVVSIILNTNRREDTLACLGSLAKLTYPNHHVLVLDNASTDGSIGAIQSNYPTVEIISLNQNLGYAGNNNVGIEAALQQKAAWVFVLNEDTTVAPDCLTRLIDAEGSTSRVGILGPMVYHHDEPDVIQSAGGVLTRTWSSYHIAQNEFDCGQFQGPRQVDWISGCALLVRREVIEEVGALDERFFYYWEETEWCLRALRAGWKVLHVPEARIWHKGVQRDYLPSPNITYYNTRNRLLLMSKHHAPWWAWLAVIGRISATLISWTVQPKWRSKRLHRDAIWQGLRDFLSHRWGMRP